MGHTYRWQIWGRNGDVFDGSSYDGASTGIWVIHTGGKSGGEMLTLFRGYSYDGVSGYSYDSVSAGILVIQTGGNIFGRSAICVNAWQLVAKGS